VGVDELVAVVHCRFHAAMIPSAKKRVLKTDWR
jgi:hypothetical protein